MGSMIFEPNIAMPPNIPCPDSFIGNKGARPSPDFVVGRRRDGSVASIYSDVEWDLSAYHPTGQRFSIHLARWCNNPPTQIQLAIVDEMRWMMFIVMWLRNGPPLANHTLQSYIQALRELAKFANLNGGSVFAILSDAKLLKYYIGYGAPHNIGALSALVKTLIELGREKTGIEVVQGALIGELQTIGKDYKSGLKQHPPIPTRIYASLISGLLKELDDFEAISDKFVAVMEACHADPALGRQRRSQRRILPLHGRKRDYRPEMAEVLEKYGLADYFRAKGLPLGIHSLARGITTLFIAAKLTIHVFSGMRDEEAANLPFDCLEEVKAGKKCHYKIAGGTTKLNQGNLKKTRWVTSSEGARAVRLVQRISGVIYGLIQPGAKGTPVTAPLFVSPSYLEFGGKLPVTYNGELAQSKLDSYYTAELFGRIVPKIQDSDLVELEQIDPYRAWRSEDRFSIGVAWPLTNHQLRRSLALYASRSGLVSLPSLRRQLQHITEEMSRYYAAGSVYAKDIIGDNKEHFGREWQETQPESQALAYIANVLLSDERLFGAHGVWLESHVKRQGHVLTLDDRASTLKRFKAGEMAYRETTLGGCTEITPCDKKAMRSIIACFDCSKTVIKLPRLTCLIAAQTHLVEQLDPTTIEWRTESADLEILQVAKLKYEQQMEQRH